MLCLSIECLMLSCFYCGTMETEMNYYYYCNYDYHRNDNNDELKMWKSKHSSNDFNLNIDNLDYLDDGLLQFFFKEFALK